MRVTFDPAVKEFLTRAAAFSGTMYVPSFGKIDLVHSSSSMEKVTGMAPQPYEVADACFAISVFTFLGTETK